MTTRAIVRQLLLRAGIMTLVILLFLLSMNWVIDRRNEEANQQKLRETFGNVLSAERYEEIFVPEFASDVPDIQLAYRAYNATGETLGYVITTLTPSEQGSIACRCGISLDGTTLLALEISNEGNTVSPGMTQDFFRQFSNARLPMALTVDLPDNREKNEVYPPVSGLTDGVFRADNDEADESGYKDFVEITVSAGRIVDVIWDAVQTDGGNNRAQASVNGEYKLDDNKTIWAAQAYAMQNKLVEVQDPARIAIKASGTTDVVPGVYISVNEFLILANKCIEDSKNSENASPLTVGETAATQNGTDPAPSETSAAIPENSLSQESDETAADDSFYGNEDGIITDKSATAVADSIDGLPYSDIRTQITFADGSENVARAIVRSANYAFRFVLNVRKGGV